MSAHTIQQFGRPPEERAKELFQIGAQLGKAAAAGGKALFGPSAPSPSARSEAIEPAFQAYRAGERAGAPIGEAVSQAEPMTSPGEEVPFAKVKPAQISEEPTFKTSEAGAGGGQSLDLVPIGKSPEERAKAAFAAGKGPGGGGGGLAKMLIAF